MRESVYVKVCHSCGSIYLCDNQCHLFFLDDLDDREGDLDLDLERDLCLLEEW